MNRDYVGMESFVSILLFVIRAGRILFYPLSLKCNLSMKETWNSFRLILVSLTARRVLLLFEILLVWNPRTQRTMWKEKKKLLCSSKLLVFDFTLEMWFLPTKSFTYSRAFYFKSIRKVTKTEYFQVLNAWKKLSIQNAVTTYQ